MIAFQEIQEIEETELDKNNNKEPYIHDGKLLSDLRGTESASLGEYEAKGGMQVFKKILSEADKIGFISDLDDGGLRGRAGAGYPTGHKWWVAANSEEKERFFVCNANAAPDGIKEKALLNLNPYRIVEAAACAALVIGAQSAIIALPPHLKAEKELIEKAAAEMRSASYLGDNVLGTGSTLDVTVFQTLGTYIIGEETALLELLEGRLGRPRTKPPLPTSVGLFGKPTVVNNLETMLQAFLIFKDGPELFKEQGVQFSSGTMLFHLSGQVKRPGLYELPLGTPLRDLIYEHGQGIEGDLPLKAVFPGGMASVVLNREEIDVGLDYDSISEQGSTLGSGSVIVVSEAASMYQVGLKVSRFLSDASCGKCQPCKDGTHRTVVMLENIKRIEEKSIDRIDQVLPSSKRTRTLNVIQPMGAISYTDNAIGLEKITQLCEFFMHRGDCNHSKEAAMTVQSIVRKFEGEFQQMLAEV